MYLAHAWHNTPNCAQMCPKYTEISKEVSFGTFLSQKGCQTFKGDTLAQFWAKFNFWPIQMSYPRQNGKRTCVSNIFLPRRKGSPVRGKFVIKLHCENGKCQKMPENVVFTAKFIVGAKGVQKHVQTWRKRVLSQFEASIIIWCVEKKIGKRGMTTKCLPFLWMKGVLVGTKSVFEKKKIRLWSISKQKSSEKIDIYSTKVYPQYFAKYCTSTILEDKFQLWIAETYAGK